MRLARRLAGIAAGLLPAALGCGTVAGGARATLLAPGTVAPPIAALDQTGATRTLQEFRGRPLIVFFYPRDGTPGCTREACAFRDAWQRYQQAGVAIVGVSTDSVAAHARFAAEHRLPFALLADPDATIARDYGVDLTFGLAERVSFLIDGEGRIARVFPDVDPGVHAAEVLAAAASLPTPAPPGPS
ncbi:MAG: peroxiredoxin [Deltaproteobacteria bacterium]|nr:peroxiredoxin [Deltaproteobacteria bacterium]